MGTRVKHNEAKCRFEIDLGDGTALAAYSLHDDAIVFTHTEVPTKYERQGIGTRLIVTGLEYAREQRLSVVPSCPFFAAYMKKHPEVQDLLTPVTASVSVSEHLHNYAFW